MTVYDVLRGCAEAIYHGPADGAGRCPWCRVKYTHAQPRPVRQWWQPAPADAADLAYRRFYDPNFGVAQTDTDPHRPGRREAL